MRRYIDVAPSTVSELPAIGLWMLGVTLNFCSIPSCTPLAITVAPAVAASRFGTAAIAQLSYSRMNCFCTGDSRLNSRSIGPVNLLHGMGVTIAGAGNAIGGTR